LPKLPKESRSFGNSLAEATSIKTISKVQVRVNVAPLVGFVELVMFKPIFKLLCSAEAAQKRVEKFNKDLLVIPLKSKLKSN